ncbi:MAG TPA: phosphoribosylglycinamide formyltransferase [Candidatus Omnitrophota bacterium]|nr:phosphoribosylglycinamide formyltransferase [Candidatus Omnitrophota bacterium]HPD84402.1 phosphoribosylglycinamide formyltransferase [Candidatus Omnitrophota bacterium]HRZ03260.1 phosphoribosylglycinamide formyltransferase [Candidatus Omnitrophota bacterium]
MMNFAVFASGNGSNLQAIINAVKKGRVRANLKLVVSDNPSAYALKRAKKANIRSIVVEPIGFPDRESFDREIIKRLEQEQIDFIVLAGFMRILSPVFIRKYPHKILNIHPAILPAFKGAHAIKDAFEYGVKVTGVTVHFIDEKVDHGPIILQELVKVSPRGTLASLEKKIHAIEHKIYPKAVDLFARGCIKIHGRTVKIR